MSFFRDIVAAECAEPNPVGRVVNNLTSEKFGIHQDQWVHGGDMTHEENLQSRIRRQEERELNEDEFDVEADRMFHNLDQQAGRPNLFDPREYEDFEPEPFEMHRPPPNEHLLSTLLKAFVTGAPPKGRFEDFPDLGLTERDKEKIRDRAGVMSRHFYPNQNQGFADEKLDGLMNALHIARHPDERELEASWRNATTTSTSTSRGWENEYAQHNREAQVRDEFEDYDEMIRNTSENKSWMEENLHRASPNRWASWEREYARGDSDSWVREYSTRSERQIEEDTMESAWNDAAHDRLMEAAWGDGEKATGRAGGNARNLTELTDAITKIDDPKLQASNFMQFMHKINQGKVSFGDNRVIEQDLMGNGLVNNDWLQEYDDFADDFVDPREWSREYEGFQGSIAADRLAEYEFVVNNASNPYAAHEDPYTAGVELFNKGMITEAILALETEVQRNPTNSVAWHALGQAHAENDKDNLAIISLEKAVEVDPQNLDALAALAVSYTNDFARDKALETLETWLRRNKEYTHIPDRHAPAPPQAHDFYTESWSHHARVADMFLEAAQARPADPDPEVQTALGLLYNLSYEYDRAVDCFKAALTKRPQDYRLWNKLGATLANSNRGEEALGAYFKALEGKPTYVRARANLGISFLALNSYNEAAQSFLSALRLHPNAAHLWDNLKMVFRLMGRDDLEERASHNDIEAFGEDFAM